MSSKHIPAQRKWQCFYCGFIYDEAEGMPEEGIAAATRWDDIPDDWRCQDAVRASPSSR